MSTPNPYTHEQATIIHRPGVRAKGITGWRQIGVYPSKEQAERIAESERASGRWLKVELN